jgi:polysaccharide pyruvyl transferase WcaK-like protein
LEGVLREFTRQGYTPVPVAMHGSDIAPLQQLMARVGCEHLPIQTPQTADAFFALAGPCRFTLAVRLHAAILSCCTGVPPLMLAYRDKCLDFMESMELTEWQINLDNVAPGAITAGAQALADQALALRPTVLRAAQHWQAVLKGYTDRVAASAIRR